MKILLATDGSPQAKVARDLLASLALPKGSSIEVIRVVPAPSLAGLPSAIRSRLIGRALDATAADLERFARPLRSSGRSVTAAALEGRAAQTILERAARSRADLIVVGSHGLGALAATIFGSVAAEVVEGSRCPVLVARTRRASRIVAASDGSVPARRALALVESGLFGKPAVTVVSAWHVAVPLVDPDSAVVDELVMREYQRMRVGQARTHRRIAEAAAARLVKARIPATAVVREGGAAREVLAVAKAKRADLIAMGTRGRSGLASLVLGSVARGILHGSHTSLLVAPSRAR